MKVFGMGSGGMVRGAGSGFKSVINIKGDGNV